MARFKKVLFSPLAADVKRRFIIDFLHDAEHVIGRSDVFDRAESLCGSAILDVEPPARPNPFQRPGFLIPLRYYFVHRENGLYRFPGSIAPCHVGIVKAHRRHSGSKFFSRLLFTRERFHTIRIDITDGNTAVIQLDTLELDFSRPQIPTLFAFQQDLNLLPQLPVQLLQLLFSFFRCHLLSSFPSSGAFDPLL